MMTNLRGSSPQRGRSAALTEESSNCSLSRVNVARRWRVALGMRSIWACEAGSCRQRGPKNAKAHEVYLSDQAVAVLGRVDKIGALVFSHSGNVPFQDFSIAKRELDQLSGVAGWRLHVLRRTCVSGMARLGIAPHVADKILNHQGGTISGVAAVYQRHNFLEERKKALEMWGAHVQRSVGKATSKNNYLPKVA